MLSLGPSVSRRVEKSFSPRWTRSFLGHGWCDCLIEPVYPKGKYGRPPDALETMLRIHFMQQWFGLRDHGMLTNKKYFEVQFFNERAIMTDALLRFPDNNAGATQGKINRVSVPITSRKKKWT
jgi:hypothetical protein